MLRKVRAHSQGLRLIEALSSSPLTIVYQCIGNVKAAQLEDALRAEVPEKQDNLRAVPVSFRIKNSLAGATGRPDVSAFLQTTNVLVGWQLSPAAAAADGASQSSARAVRASERLEQLAEAASATIPPSRPQPPQRTFSALIKASLKLADKHPVAPLAGFFHGQRISLADLSRWSELDDMTVYGELVAQLDSVPHGLVQGISVGDGGISALLDAQSGPLLAALAARQAGGAGGPEAATAAVPAASG
ncbi:hypothetical protein GPECTOR_5g385 [Gonium pectorale]|uniref:Uncharacterized protein n=1 Tax=Gonium pectorale TaxID=33097 RepID=A0A150GWW4_GONPE|nr:hypothetical protein GPECTOR_5g385 [Gonium pectorale]|eukprot:KXZ54299.1 hypothetical protein GPECTOR_5g385 [Gonium pectorale]